MPDGRRNVVEQQHMKHNGADRHDAVQHKIGRKDDDDDHAILLDEPFNPIKNKAQFPGLQFSAMVINTFPFLWPLST